MNVFGAVLLLCCGWSLGQAESSGAQKRYTAVFMDNDEASNFHLHLVTYDKAASVNVEVEHPKFHQRASIESNSFAKITLDSQYMLRGNELSSKSIVVTSDIDISVFGFNEVLGSADASLILPEEDLDTEYFIITSQSEGSNQFAVATGRNPIEWVEVTVSGALTYQNKIYNTGDLLRISLKPHQVIQFRGTTSFTGTRILASAPVAVFTGHKCYAAPKTACDLLFEQLHPVKNWGTTFPVFPLSGHKSDLITIMAASNDTLVKVDKTEHTVNIGSYKNSTVTKKALVTSSKPVLVSYLSQKEGQDPFLMFVPPAQLTRKYYKFITEKDYFNYVMISSQAASPLGFVLDGEPMSHVDFPPEAIGGFRSWEIALGKVDGQHEIYNKDSPFTIYVYGFSFSQMSYGYSMGQETRYPVSSTINKMEDLGSGSSLKCFADRAEFRLPLSFVSGAKLSVSDFHLNDPGCRGTQEGQFLVINASFDQCGFKALNEDGVSIHVNTVYGTVPTTDVYRVVIPLRCGMEKCKALGFSLRPQVTEKASLGFCNVTLKVYKHENFTDPITTYPYEVRLHSRLHVEFQLETTNMSLQLLVESCIASPSLEDKEKSYKLIDQGCPEDLTLIKHRDEDKRLQRFSFQVFKFRDLKEVFMSCNIVICESGTSPNRCTQGCLPKRQRRNADNAEEYLKSARLSQGPLVFISDEQRGSGASNPLFVIIVCIVGGLAAMGLAFQRYYYRKQAMQT